jgi:hypothetical protein
LLTIILITNILSEKLRQISAVQFVVKQVIESTSGIFYPMVMVLVSSILLASNVQDNCPVGKLLWSGLDFSVSHSHS